MILATLSYDRLGVGKSDHPSGLDIAQPIYEAMQIVSIANQLRAGSLPGVPAFDTVIALGHSYGSVILSLDFIIAPEAFNATVLTGFSGNMTDSPLGTTAGSFELANTVLPNRWGHLDNTYIATPDVSIDQKGFLHYPNYTQNALEVFEETKGEIGIGNLYAPSVAGLVPAGTPYTRPVYIITGEYDGMNCK